MVELIFVGISTAIGVALEFVVDLLASVFGFDFFFFANTFPYAADAFVIFQRIAVGLILLISGAQILFFFFGKENTRPSPLRLAMSTFLAVGGVFYGNYILEGIMNLAQLPYDALLNTDVTVTIDFSVVSWFLNEYFLDIPVLAYIAILLLIGISFIKLLLEAVERYVVLFCLVYLSPLASATLASEATNGIFKRYFTMFLSQCLLLILNVWSLQMTVSMFQNLPTADGPVINLIIGYAFLRFSSRIDSYLNSLGLNAAVTGAGLGAELMASGMAIMMGASNMMGGGKAFAFSGKGAGAAGGGNILGAAADSISNFARKYSPAAGARSATLNALGAVGQTAAQSVGAASNAIKGASGIGEKAAAGARAAKDAWQKNWHPNINGAKQATANDNLLFRGLGAKPFENIDGLSPENLRTMSGSGYLADAALSNIETNGSEIVDPQTVSAMASGIGAENLSPEMQEAIHVGNGVIPAEGLDYYTNANGLHMGYEKDGRLQSMDIKNASQFSQLSHDEQKLYTPFYGADGTKYYYRQSTGRALSDSQKRQAATTNELTAFAQNPASKLSPDAVAAMRRDPSHISAAYRSMRESGTRFTANTAEGRNAIHQLLANTPTDGKLNDGKQLAMAQLQSGAPVDAYANGNGVHVAWKDQAGNAHSFDVVAPGAQSDPSVADTYRPYTMSNGEVTMANYRPPLSVQERIQENLTSSAANPGTVPMARETLDMVARSPAMTNQYLSSLPSGAEVTNTDQVSALVQGVQINGRQHSEAARLQTDAIRNLENGTVTDSWANQYSIGTSWTDESGSHQFVAFTQAGADRMGTDMQSLGFDRIHSGGETYYVPATPMARETELLSKATRFGTGNGMTINDYGYAQNLGAAKKNDIVNHTFAGLQQSGRTVTLTESNQREIADLVNLSSFNGISKNQQTQISSAIAAGEANVEFTSRGLYAESEEGVFQALRADQVISKNGQTEAADGKRLFDANYLNGEGYQRTNLNGQEYWARYAHPNDPSPIRKEV